MSSAAETAKNNGNVAFKAKNYAEAIKLFSEAINLEPTEAAFYSNRSAAYLKDGQHAEALADGEKCIELKSDWNKGYSRKASALLMLQKGQEAIDCYNAGMEVCSDSKPLVDGLAAAKKAGEKKKKKKKKKKGKKGKEEKKEGEVDEEKIKSSPVIGIDLGTTFSCVGVWMGDGVTIIPAKDGSKTIPSYVFFDEETGQRSTGHAAKNQRTRQPQNVVYDVKRIIGQRYNDSGVKSDIERLQYKCVKGEDGKPMVSVQIAGEEHLFQPEEISAMVLRHCKELAENFLGCEVFRAVVTVPAYFNDAQRQATKVAGRIAGMDVLRIINEPTAAALSYGLDNAIKSAEQALNVVIFDLGGGTFDVSILSIEGGVFNVKATGGDTRLGGEDFDNNLVNHLVAEVDKQGLGQARDNPRVMQRLRKAAEMCKRELSSSNSSEVRLDGLYPNKNFVCKITRALFEKLNRGPFMVCMETVKRVLKDAKLKGEDINEIVLVGGSTRIPKLQEMLIEVFGGKVLCKALNPDEAVAYGAAIQGAILSGQRNSKTDSLLLMDVTPLSLGIELVGGVMSVVIPRNTTIPVSITKTYTTDHDYQTEDDIKVFEGERPTASKNNLLGEFKITGIERAKKGEPQISVNFSIDSNGILEVTAKDQKTGAKAAVQISNRSACTTDQIDQMVAEAAKFKVEDEDRLRRAESRNELEQAIYECLELAAELAETDTKKSKILTDAANKEQAWLDEGGDVDAKTSAISLRRRTLQRRLGARAQ